MFEIAGYNVVSDVEDQIRTMTQLLCVRHLQFRSVDVTFAESNTADGGQDNGVSMLMLGQRLTVLGIIFFPLWKIKYEHLASLHIKTSTILVWFEWT